MSIYSTIRAWFGGKKQALAELPPASTVSEIGASGAGAPSPDASIDFVSVLTAAGIQAEARDRVVKAKQLLRSLPTDGPSATKRQVVEAAFQVFEIPTQKIIHGASAEIAALRSYIQLGEEEKATRLADGERRIVGLEGEIRDARASMELAAFAQERRQRLTNEEIATVQHIVDFFAQEVTPAPPKNGDVVDAVDVGHLRARPELDLPPNEEAALGLKPRGSNSSANLVS